MRLDAGLAADLPGPRQLLLECFQAALVAVDGRRCVRAQLQTDAARGALDGDWHVIAIGKAAGSMALGALDVLAHRIVSGLVVVPPGHVPEGLADCGEALRVVFGAHPIPGASSVDAGGQLNEFVAALAPDAQVVCLVSGGASSLVELPVPGIGLDELARVGEWVMGGGQSIAVTNAVRRQLSQVKNGGLARWLHPRRVIALFISDVPHDDPRVIGSGLLHGFPPAAQRALLEERADIPPDIAAMLRHAEFGTNAGAMTPLNAVSVCMPTRDVEPRSRRVPYSIVASHRSAALAALTAARTAGFEATVVRRRFAGDAAELGAKFARSTLKLSDHSLRIWTGESTVLLPPAPGRGGRNQHLALSAACEFSTAGWAGRWLLAAGTDGIDGVTNDAGAVIDAQTCVRGRDAGLDCRAALARADSGSFLEAAGDLLHTGPTYTNVGDMVLGLCWKGEA